MWTKNSQPFGKNVRKPQGDFLDPHCIWYVGYQIAAEQLFIGLIVGTVLLLIGIPIFGLTLYVIKIGGTYFFMWSWIFLFMTSLVCLLILSMLISAPSQGVYYCQQLTVSDCLSVCPSVKKLQIASFLFLDGIEPFFGRQFSMCPSKKTFSSIFDLGPLAPKIYSPKLRCKIAYKSACMADRPEMFGPTRGFSGMADSMEPCKILWGRPLLPWQRNLGQAQRSSRLPACFTNCFVKVLLTGSSQTMCSSTKADHE